MGDRDLESGVYETVKKKNNNNDTLQPPGYEVAAAPSAPLLLVALAERYLSVETLQEQLCLTYMAHQQTIISQTQLMITHILTMAFHKLDTLIVNQCNVFF